jgi:hypothetical protein
MRNYCLALLFLFLMGGLQAQENEYQNRAAMDMYEKAVIDLISKNFILKEKIKNHAFYVSRSTQESHVVILGQSSDETNPVGFNSETLKDLFHLIKFDNPKAVFFNGNLVYSLLNSSDPTKKGELLTLPVQKNIFGEEKGQEIGIYSNQAFNEALINFQQVVTEFLGPDIPFYPLMGTQESLGPDTAEIIRKQFHLENATILESNQLVYTVPIDNTLFLIISTDYYQKEKNEPTLHSLSEPLWNWLQETLKNEGSKYAFRFVIGSDPAYSTSAVFDLYKGLDQNKQDRNRFWRILIDSKVRAYFSGGEILYDRSYRYGIWQIITGGAGTPNNVKDTNDDTFYHFVLLTIPQKPTQDPIVQVFDNEGEIKDDFVLSKEPPFLFDFRISKQP